MLSDERLEPTTFGKTTHMKSDFSGEYILDRRASTLSSGAAAVQSAVVRIEHREPVTKAHAADRGACAWSSGRNESLN